MLTGIKISCLDAINELKRWFRAFNRVGIMLSGGVDSTTLLAVAVEVLGNHNVIAVTVASPVHHSKDLDDAKRYCDLLNVRHVVIEAPELMNIEEFARNDLMRCYYCKKFMVSKILSSIKDVDVFIEGTNADDVRYDFRPGYKAIKEFKQLIRSPYIELSISKECIRSIAKSLGLDIHDKPPNSCLATRIPYGSRITLDLINRIRNAEDYLIKLGFQVVRVRVHGDMARIEVGIDEMPRLIEYEVRSGIIRYVKSLGFKYVVLDLEGYRSSGGTLVSSDQ